MWPTSYQEGLLYRVRGMHCRRKYLRQMRARAEVINQGRPLLMSAGNCNRAEVMSALPPPPTTHVYYLTAVILLLTITFSPPLSNLLVAQIEKVTKDR